MEIPYEKKIIKNNAFTLSYLLNIGEKFNFH